MLIRKVKMQDAESFWQLQYELDQETSFMMYEPGERKKDLACIQELIQNSCSGQDLLLVAEDNTVLVGYLSAQRGEFNRIRHSAYIVTGIRSQYTNQGIGTLLFRLLDQWAEENQLKRLELTVMCPNEAAKHLYEKCGFQTEGVKKISMLVDGEYIDEYYMAKIYL